MALPSQQALGQLCLQLGQCSVTLDACMHLRQLSDFLREQMHDCGSSIVMLPATASGLGEAARFIGWIAMCVCATGTRLGYEKTSDGCWLAAYVVAVASAQTTEVHLFE